MEIEREQISKWWTSGKTIKIVLLKSKYEQYTDSNEWPSSEQPGEEEHTQQWT